jgi:hypothetical protein
MRRLSACLLACFLLAASTSVVAAAKPATRGIVPANARPLGYSLVEIGTAWNHWAFASPADTSPLLAVRCEPSPLDPRIWFLPVSLGGEFETTCEVPRGAFLVLTAGGWECSSIEPEPFFGANEAEMLDCVDEGFKLLSYVELTFNGKTTTDLHDYVVTTDLDTLPADNLLGPDAGLTMDKGYYLVVSPLSPGTHTLRAYDEFESIDFQAGITYTIVVE